MTGDTVTGDAVKPDPMNAVLAGIEAAGRQGIVHGKGVAWSAAETQRLARRVGATHRVVELAEPDLPPGGIWLGVARSLGASGSGDPRRQARRAIAEAMHLHRHTLLVVEGAGGFPAATLASLIATTREEPGLRLLLFESEDAALPLPLPEDAIPIEAGDAALAGPTAQPEPPTPPESEGTEPANAEPRVAGSQADPAAAATAGAEAHAEAEAEVPAAAGPELERRDAPPVPAPVAASAAAVRHDPQANPRAEPSSPEPATIPRTAPRPPQPHPPTPSTPIPARPIQRAPREPARASFAVVAPVAFGIGILAGLLWWWAGGDESSPNPPTASQEEALPPVAAAPRPLPDRTPEAAGDAGSLGGDPGAEREATAPDAEPDTSVVAGEEPTFAAAPGAEPAPEPASRRPRSDAPPPLAGSTRVGEGGTESGGESAPIASAEPPPATETAPLRSTARTASAEPSDADLPGASVRGGVEDGALASGGRGAGTRPVVDLPGVVPAEVVPTEVAAPERAPASAAGQGLSAPININSYPWARIEIDGRTIGETPIGELRLPPGQYDVHAVFADGSTRVRRVRADDNERFIMFGTPAE